MAGVKSTPLSIPKKHKVTLENNAIFLPTLDPLLAPKWPLLGLLQQAN